MSLSKEEFEKIFDFISRIGGKGSSVQSIYEQLRGINSLGTHPTMPPVREQFGLTFFTRPRLNLTDGNLRAFRPFFSMIGGNDGISIPRAVRAMLDPVNVWNGERRGSPLTNHEQAFIPWLSNGLVSQSGWPEISPGTFSSSEGNHHEAWSMIDDTIKNYRVWDLNTALRNGAGNVIIMLLFTWVCYGSLVYEGDMVPYPDAIMQHRIDYHTRIYRFALDANKKRITSWWSTIAYPYVAPTATGANMSIDNPFNTESQQVSVNWKCHGCDTFDPIVFTEFNNIVAYFNPNMHPAIRDKMMVQINEDTWNLFTYDTFFWIDPEEQILERWVSKEVYDSRMGDTRVAWNTRVPKGSLLPVGYGGKLDSQTTQMIAQSLNTPVTGNV
jgi:hypothetical protein